MNRLMTAALIASGLGRLDATASPLVPIPDVAIAKADVAQASPTPPPPTRRDAIYSSQPTPADRPPSERLTPAPPTPGHPAPITVKERWRIQLGAFATRAEAEGQWNRIRARFAGAQPFYVKPGAMVHLQAGPYPTEAHARRACAASGASCTVLEL